MNEVQDDDYREIDREIKYLCGVVTTLQERNALLVEALEAMLEVEDEECWHDHHGYCQAHNLRCNDTNEPECQVMLAKQALTENKE